MIALIALGIIAAWAAAATVVVTARDGYRRIPTADWSYVL